MRLRLRKERCFLIPDLIYLSGYYGHIESTMDLSPLDLVKNLHILISDLIRHCSPHIAEMLHTNKRNIIAAWR
jgi:hypothetical protein